MPIQNRPPTFTPNPPPSNTLSSAQSRSVPPSDPTMQQLLREVQQLQARVAAQEAMLSSIFGSAGTVTINAQQKLELAVGSVKLVLDPTGARLTAPGNTTIETSNCRVMASNVALTTPMAAVSGVVRCDTIIANSVVGSSYTPGAGNIM